MIAHVMRNLSKSKILAYRQCPKRLWLEIHKPELRDTSGSATIFTISHQVGEIARRLYDPEGNGITINIDALGHSEALAQTAVLLGEGKAPIFEAGFTIVGALAYADVMLPDDSDGTVRWKMIEVKSSSSVKDYHHDDIAVQAHIAKSSGVRLSSVSLAHIDSSFVYSGGDDYRGLLKEMDMTEEALSRGSEVQEWIAAAQCVAALTDEPVIKTGPQCTTPFACGFCDYCNRDMIVEPTSEYPISSLPNLKGWRRDAVADEETNDLREISDHLLTPMQLRVKQASVSGKAYFDADGAAADLAVHGFPAYFLDFETVRFTVPLWKGTRPFQQIPFQFSLHILDANGSPQHHGFLDLSGNDPSFSCVQSLVDLCGKHGPIFAYNSCFECRVMHDLAARFPEFAPALQSIIERVEDLLLIARYRYYHPIQHGSWSLKAVLPALCPELSYDALEGVQDGNMAASAYQEAIATDTTCTRKAQLESQLHEYCKLDTFAMVRMWEIFRGTNSESKTTI